jgi:hypothetical protein
MGLVANNGGMPQFFTGAITLDTVSVPLNVSTDNLNPDVNQKVSQYFLKPNKALNLTGIVGGIKNQQLRLINTTAFTVTLKNNTSSDVGNRFILSGDILMPQWAIVDIQWDEAANGWLVCAESGTTGGGGSLPGGTTGQVQYNNGGVLGGASLTWTEASSTLNLPGATKTLIVSTQKQIDFSSNVIHINANVGGGGFCVVTCSDEFDATANQINFHQNVGFNVVSDAINSESLWLLGAGSSWEVDCDSVTYASAAGGTPAFSIFNALDIGVDTSATLHGAVAYTGGTYQAPLAGDTITLANATSFLQLEPAGTIATLTIKMPIAPINGQKIDFATTQTVTTLTMDGNGKTLIGAPVSIAAGSGAGGAFSMRYRASNNSWYRAS